jgi:hypothetical protein
MSIAPNSWKACPAKQCEQNLQNNVSDTRQPLSDARQLLGDTHRNAAA